MAGTVVSAYDWALFNFDRVCDSSENVKAGNYEVLIFDKGGGGEGYLEKIDVIGKAARVCNRDTCCQQVCR